MLLVNIRVLPAPQASAAMVSQPCVDQGPSSGAYVAHVCITNPVEGATLSGNAPFTVEVTATAGTLPVIDRVRTYVGTSAASSGSSFVSDYADPYTMQIPTARWKDGAYVLSAMVYFADGFETTTLAQINATFQNGVTADVHSDGSWTPKTSGASPLNLVAVGDGAGGLEGATNVASLVSSMNPDLLFYLGDVYNQGTYGEFTNYYEPTLGALKDRTNPVPGNHEYGTSGARGYMDYWNTNKHYYSFNSGGWHFIALDNTRGYGQYTAGTAQFEWLRQDLQSNANTACTMVFFHHPHFGLASKGSSDPNLTELWSLMAGNGVDVVLSGHEHNYQRWKPLDANGQEASNGIIEFVVGTGGHETMGFSLNDSRVAARASNVDGALKFSLNAGGGSAQFFTTAGTVRDSTSFNCHDSIGNPVPTPAPDPNAPMTFEPVADAMVQAANPDANLGTSTVLRSDKSPLETSYLRFDVQGATEPISRAVLRLWVRDGTADAPAVHGSSDVTWDEIAVTWNNQPAVGEPVADLGAATAGEWIEYDVSSLVTGNGPVTLALVAESNDLLSVNSRENGSNRPQLHIGGDPATVTPTVTPTPDGSTEVLASADARVEEANPTLNYGTSPLLRADGGAEPDIETYLKFSVTGLTEAPTSAKVRIFVGTGSSAGSSDGPEIYVGSTSDWDETTITWENRPARDTQALRVMGAVNAATWIEYDVSPIVTGDGDYTFVLATSSADATDFNSRETSLQPRLVLSGTASTVTPTVTATAAPGGTFTFEPVADAMVQEATPDATYGKTTILRADQSPKEESYLRFDVQAGTVPIGSAKLRLWVRDGSGNAPAIATSTDVTWDERTIAWNTKPAYGAPGPDLGAVSSGTWVEYDVTSLIKSNGLVTLVLVPQSTDAMSVNSRENATERPQLVINQDGATATVTPTATLTPTPTATMTPTATPSPTPIAGSNPTYSGSKLAITTSSSSVTSTDPAQAHDGSTSTHWFTTATTPPTSAILTLDLGQTRQLSGIKWTYRLPEMDTMTLQVSTDNATWTSLGTSTTRAYGTWEGQATTAQARYVRMVFDNPSARTRLGFVSEVQVWGAPLATPTPAAGSNPTFTGGKLAIATSSSSVASTDPAQAHDGSTSTHWFTTGTTAPAGAVLTLDLGQTRQLSGVKWTYRLPEMDTMTLQVSANGTSWSTVSTTTTRAQGTWEGSKTTAQARYVRMVFDNPSARTRLGFVSEVQIWGTAIASSPAPAGSNPTFTGGRLTIAKSSSSVTSTSPAYAHDGSTYTHWFTTGPTPPSSAVLTLDLGTTRQLSGVKWTYRLPEMDKMTLQVSADGKTWTSVSTTTARAQGTWEGSRTTAKARYVRMVFNNPSGRVKLGYVSEVQVWGTSTTTSATTLQRSATTTQATAATSTPTATPTSRLALVPVAAAATPTAPATPAPTAPVATVVATETPVATPYAVGNGWSSDPNQPWTWLTDADPATVWTATLAAPPATAEAGFDLGQPVALDHLRLLPAWPLAGTLEIQLSNDGTTWYRLTSLRLADQRPDEGLDVPVDRGARYVRFLLTNPDGAATVGALTGVEVWDDPTGTVQPLELLERIEPTPAPTEAVPTPEPTVAPVLEPTPEPSVAPIVEPTQEPVIETPEPVVEPTPEPTLAPEPTPAPAVEAAPATDTTTQADPAPAPEDATGGA
jgi:predicted phosphodiesterase